MAWRLFAALLLVAVPSAASSGNGKRSMLWLSPPQWVNGAFNATEWAAIKTGLKQHRNAINVIGTVGYSIDPLAKGWWGANNPGVEMFNREMRAMGFKVHPLIGGLCGDAATCMKKFCGNVSGSVCQIEAFRKIWASPQPFIDRAVELIRAGDWDGINIDFESGAGTADDAAKFAVFLAALSDAVHAVGGRVSVDTNWGAYLNPGTLSQGNKVDTFCDMQTYGLHDRDFIGDMERDSKLTTLSRYGLGICPTCCNPCEDDELKPPRKVKWHTKNITKRMAMADAAGVMEVDIWMNLDLGETCSDATGNSCWWDQIEAWLHGKPQNGLVV